MTTEELIRRLMIEIKKLEFEIDDIKEILNMSPKKCDHPNNIALHEICHGRTLAACLNCLQLIILDRL